MAVISGIVTVDKLLAFWNLAKAWVDNRIESAISQIPDASEVGS